MTAGGTSARHRELIIRLAAGHKLPAVYYERYWAAAGGLISLGPDQIDQYRQAAGYIDRILKGEKPGDLPVQAPTKYEMVLNLKTAKALGLDVPASVFARAGEVIEGTVASSSRSSAAQRHGQSRGGRSRSECDASACSPCFRTMIRYIWPTWRLCGMTTLVWPVIGTVTPGDFTVILLPLIRMQCTRSVSKIA
jgi:ABC transporter substrate binding protein